MTVSVGCAVVDFVGPKMIFVHAGASLSFEGERSFQNASLTSGL